VEVPDVLGLELDEARLELSRAGFGVEESTCYAPATTEGIVVRQTPAGGAETDQGATVNVCLSVRTLPSPGTNTPDPDEESQTEAEYAQVPDVIGESKADAEIKLKNMGFEAASIRECGPEGSQSANTVWKQDPAGGTTEETGSTVTFWHNPAVC
jgi:beta-lactam-binding protein with PASTA domain